MVNRTAVRSLGLRLFATCWLIYTAFWTPYIVREHFPALALAEDGALNVEKFESWCEDIFRSPKGGAYINNNPGASMIGAIPLALFRPVLGRLDSTPGPTHSIHGDTLLKRAAAEGRARYFLFTAFVTVALAMAPLSAAAVAMLGGALFQSGVPAWGAVATAMLCAFGTPVFFRTEYLNHNMIVCSLGMIAFLVLWDPRRGTLKTRPIVISGALGGYAVFCDFSGLVLLAALALYCWMRAGDGSGSGRWRTLLLFSAAAAPSLLALVVYQRFAFGNGLLPSQHYMPATAPTVRGYRGFDWPSRDLLWANFFNPKFGLFIYCPLLLAALASPWVRRVRYAAPRREQAVLFFYFALFTLFCAANQYSWLQPSTGFRYLIPIVPWLLVLAVHVLQALPSPVVIVLAVLSILESWAMASWRDNRPLACIRHAFEGGFPLPWVRHASELGMIRHPLALTWAVYSVVLVCVYLLWRGRRSGEAVTG